MDAASQTSGGNPPEISYTAQVASPLFSGEATLAVGTDDLAVTALFDAAEIPYADMTALRAADYAVTVQTEGGDFVFSRMGSWLRPFFDALSEAYNKKVLKALFVTGSPLLTAQGVYRYAENGAVTGGTAPVRLFDDCVCTLPTDLHARRIPLCFLTGLDKGDYEITLRLSERESYTLSKLGYDTAPFADALEKRLRALREKALTAVKELDPSLSAMQAAAVARLMPEGAAVLSGQLSALAPSFLEAIKSKIDAGRAAETYRAFCELCNPSQIYIGFKKNTAPAAGAAAETEGVPPEDAGTLPGNLPLGLPDGEAPEESDPYMLWMIAPSPDGKSCAVEFAGDPEDAAATFVYRFDGAFDDFAAQLNRALEAIAFKRLAIRLSDEELLRPEHADCRMAVQRNPSLRFVRACFAGRIIHSGSWRRKLSDMWGLGS